MNEDVIGLPATMLGLVGFVVLAAGEYGGELELLVESTQTLVGCPECGVVATAHGRRTHLVGDVAAGGRPVLLVWRKRLWRCGEAACPKPQTNGKVERYHRTLAREWAHRRAWASNQERAADLQRFLDRYNYARPHTALKGRPPVSRVPGVTNLAPTSRPRTAS